MKYSIRIVPPEEDAKANDDPSYAPSEVEIAQLECEPWEVRGIVNRRLLSGIYPRGSQYVEMDGAH